MFRFNVLMLIMLCSVSVSAQQLDPTRPFGSVARDAYTVKKAAFKLQSIIKTANSKKAVINGKVVAKGESYKGYVVVEITNKSVVLDSPQGRKKLSLFSGVIAKSQ